MEGEKELPLFPYYVNRSSYHFDTPVNTAWLVWCVVDYSRIPRKVFMAEMVMQIPLDITRSLAASDYIVDINILDQSKIAHGLYEIPDFLS